MPRPGSRETGVGLLSVQVEDFRCFHEARLELGADLTLIQGPNGSGKSSLLEAIYLLGRGRSFRTHHLDAVIRTGTQHLRVFGRVSAGDHHIFPIGVEAQRRKTIARINGEPASSLAALSVAFPVQIIEPGVHKLIEEGPLWRRRYLDWGVFHVEQPYLDLWQRFHRLVKQRNAALKANATDAELDSWDAELAAIGEKVSIARSSYVQALRPHVARALDVLLEGHDSADFSYSRGWSEDRDLEAALKEGRLTDRRRKVSTLGPQRADLSIKVSGVLARNTVSRGQQKLLATALVLGQLSYHSDVFGMKTTLLLDDPFAELDSSHLARLMREVRRLNTQVVVTSFQADPGLFGAPQRVFHVERGSVTQV